MRRSTLLAGLAVFVIAGASVAYMAKDSADRTKQHQKTEVHNLALCEKMLEITASLYSYNNHRAPSTDLASKMQTLHHWNLWYTSKLEGETRQRAYKLGYSPSEYNTILANARLAAERAVIPQINNAEDPLAKATELIGTCVPWPNDYSH